MVLYQQLDRFQNKIHFQRFAHRIGQDLLCAGVQDRGEVAESAAERDVCDVRQEDGSRPMRLEFPVDQILRSAAHSDGSLQSAVGIRLSDGAGELVFPHQAADLLHVHSDTHVQKPHMNAANALCVAPEPVCLQDLFECRPVLRLPKLSVFFRTHPVVVAGAGDTCQFAQVFHGKNVVPIRQRGANGLKSLSGAVHGYSPGLPCSRMTFFKNAICCWRHKISRFMRLAASSDGADAPSVWLFPPPGIRTPPRAPS